MPLFANTMPFYSHTPPLFYVMGRKNEKAKAHWKLHIHHHYDTFTAVNCVIWICLCSFTHILIHIVMCNKVACTMTLFCFWSFFLPQPPHHRPDPAFRLNAICTRGWDKEYAFLLCDVQGGKFDFWWHFWRYYSQFCRWHGYAFRAASWPFLSIGSYTLPQLLRPSE